MVGLVIICAVIFLLMILGILFVPAIRIKGKITLDTYWVITLSGLAVLLILGYGDLKTVWNALIADTAINPLKILVLFISMTLLSVYLDEAGFFKYLANVTLKRAGKNQLKLFFYLFAIVSVLTVFTSNDIIILSFTPFICYFSKNAKINPIPYLATEFVAANTWSMALIIGNPTNIYLATAYGIGFVEYFKVMAIPTLLTGITAFSCLFLLFKNKLKTPIEKSIEEHVEENVIKDKVNLVIGLIHLCGCTLVLAVGSYINLEMWLVSLCAVISLTVCTLVSSAIRKKMPVQLVKSVKRAPWQLIPFVVSMFSIIVVLSENGVTAKITEFFGETLLPIKYGIASFLSANVINNIPMSVLFCSVMEGLPQTLTLQAVFATVVGSNLGALFTPIGALAGIMWSSMLNERGLKFGYADFLKLGITVAIPSLAVCLCSLYIFI